MPAPKGIAYNDKFVIFRDPMSTASVIPLAATTKEVAPVKAMAAIPTDIVPPAFTPPPDGARGGS